jgi:hypothetical protein
MEMASFCLKIRHVFGFTWLTERSIGAGPPVIIQLSAAFSVDQLLILHVKSMFGKYRRGVAACMYFKCKK